MTLYLSDLTDAHVGCTITIGEDTYGPLTRVVREREHVAFVAPGELPGDTLVVRTPHEWAATTAVTIEEAS